MAQKKYKPGMSCEKTGKYTCYSSKGKVLNSDIDVSKDKRFPPTQEDGCYYAEK